ncbi:hypothetical protein KUTeg_019071 [Tegillarca granosa]|uniref:CUB domain-containing protein n=1 Tax=Tegillarca granosa TaxID=220873 RepID=A0ABQ9EBX1_TEGGR|nr:hypothetical protein KUTeg_019071 [Tegillarca granosa]
MEIRDGPFAYSPLIGRFCGNEFPPYIKSTSRFLWIRFKSDKNVGKDGFAAVYSYVKKKGTCDQYEEMSCDSMCISNTLICDGRNNCPNRKDERSCNKAETGSTGSESGGVDLYIIVLAVVGGFIFTVIVIGICLSCRYNRDKKQKEKEARKLASGIELSSTPSANTTLVSKKGGLPTSYYSLPRKGGGNPKDYHRNSLTSSIQTPSEGEYTDQHSDPGNYKRYMMSDQTYLDDETSPCPSLYNQGPVLTTIIERHDIPPQTNIDGTYSWGGYGWKPQQHVLDTRSPVGSPPSLSENLAKLAQYTSPKNFPNIPESKYYNPESKYEMYPDPRYLIGKEYKHKYGGTGGQESEISSPEQHRQKQQKLKSQHPDITRDLEVS